MLAYVEWIIQNESSCSVIIKLHKSKGSCSSQISAGGKNCISYSSVYSDSYFVCADVPKTIITCVSLWHLQPTQNVCSKKFYFSILHIPHLLFVERVSIHQWQTKFKVNDHLKPEYRIGRRDGVNDYQIPVLWQVVYCFFLTVAFWVIIIILMFFDKSSLVEFLIVQGHTNIKW